MTELEIWNELGNIYYDSGAFNKAIRACQKMIELDPDYGLPYINLASIYICQRRYAEAIPLFEKAIGLLGEEINKAFLWKQLGNAYRKLEDYRRASVSYRKALDIDPGDSLIQEKLAEVELTLQKSDSGSLKGIDRNFFSAPGNSHSPASSSGNACWVFKGNEPPEQVEKQAPAGDEQTPVILGSRILSDVAVEEAISKVPDLLEGARISDLESTKLPQNPISPNQESSQKNNLAEENSPIDHTEAGENIDHDAYAWLRIGILQRRKGEGGRALQFMQMALNKAEGTSNTFLIALCHYAMAPVFTDLGKIEAAIQSYQSAANLAPERVFPWNYLGYLNCMLDRFEDALAAYKEAIEHNPKDPASWNGIADVYHKLGRFEDAIAAYQLGNTFDKQNPDVDILKEYEKKIDSEQGNPLVWSEAGDIYYGTGAHDDAIDSYNKAIELDPQNRSFQIRLEKAKKALEAKMGTSNQQTSSGNDLEPLPTAAFAPQLKSSEQAETGNTPPEEQVSSKLTQNTEPVQDELVSKPDGIVDSGTEAAYWMFDKVEPMPVNSGKTYHERATSGNQLFQGAANDRASILVQLPPRPMNPVSPEQKGNVSIRKTSCENASVVDNSEASKRDDSLSHPNEKQNLPADQASLDVQIHKNDIAAYCRVTELNPQNDRAWDALGNKYESVGLHNEAITAFEKAIALDPHREAYHYHLAIALAYLEKYEQAIQVLQKVIALNPKYMLAHCALAGYYRRLGMEAEAQKHIKVARPGILAENEYNQACFESISGDADRAIALLEIALEKQQVQPDLVRSDPDLDFIRKDPRFEALLFKNGISKQ